MKAMDYFLLKEISGWLSCLNIICSLQVLFVLLVPGRVEMQLKLTREEPMSGHVGLADFLASGLKIQETQ